MGENIVAKSWALTINNYTEEDCKQLQDLDCNLVVYGKEEINTAHLQCTIIFKTAKRFNAVKKLFPRAHIEKCKDIEASINYCMKDQNYFIKDNRMEKGTRTDLKLVAQTAVEKGIDAVKKEYPEIYMKYHNGLDKLADNTYKRNFKPEITWIYGKSGSGKTRQVYEKEHEDLWISGKNLKWWQGYNGQNAVLIDDFRADFCTFHELLRILDRYPYQVEIKGGSRELCSKRMYITSQFHPSKVYNTREDIVQLTRRIDTIICTGEVHEPDQQAQLLEPYDDFVTDV